MVRQINVRTLRNKLDEGQPLCLLDIRQVWEHETAALPNSRLLPLQELVQGFPELQIALDVPIVVYCHHGIRSLSGASLLEQMGYRDVYSLAGGIDAWSREIDASVPRY